MLLRVNDFNYIDLYLKREAMSLLNTVTKQVQNTFQKLDMESYLCHIQLQWNTKTTFRAACELFFCSGNYYSLPRPAEYFPNKSHYTQKSSFQVKSQQTNIRHNGVFAFSWGKKSLPTVTKQVPPLSKWVVVLVTCFDVALFLLSSSLRIDSSLRIASFIVL